MRRRRKMETGARGRGGMDKCERYASGQKKIGKQI